MFSKSEGLISLSEKYLRYLTLTLAYEGFYDLTTDPGELHNLAASSPAQTRIEVAKLRDWANGQGPSRILRIFSLENHQTCYIE